MRMAETNEKDRGLCGNYITAEKADMIRRAKPPAGTRKARDHSVKLRASDGSMMGMPPRTG
ncbi:hypothetical protein F9L02_08835 [Brucella intermedia]|nr:hypothetical protein F9L02_08835 [Brucella intermedia]